MGEGDPRAYRLPWEARRKHGFLVHARGEQIHAGVWGEERERQRQREGGIHIHWTKVISRPRLLSKPMSGSVDLC